MVKNKHISRIKSFGFALKVVQLVQTTQKTQKEFVLSNQLLRSGTAIGAMIREAEHAESRNDFRHKMNIGLKEANESRYWLELCYRTEYLDVVAYNSLHKDVTELIKLLASIVKSLKT